MHKYQHMKFYGLNIRSFLFSLFQTLDIPTVWMCLRGMCTGQQKTKVKCGGLTSLEKAIKSRF